MANIYTLTPRSIARAIDICIAADIVPYVEGPPGIGKSDCVRQAFARANLYHDPALHDFRVSQCDPTDANGFPFMVEGRSEYMPPKAFPLEGDPIPEGYDGFGIFLDELSSGTPAVQAAFYKIILDRAVGGKKLHPKARIVAAGNRMQDRAVANRIGTALRTRMANFEMVVDKTEWIEDYAEPHGIDERIISHVGFDDDALYRFDPNSPEPTFPCPRTWAFADRLIKADPDVATDAAMLSSVLGEGRAVSFVSFVKLFTQLPDPDMLFMDPKNAPLPKELSMQYAIAMMLARKLDRQNVVTGIEYVERLPMDLQVMLMKTAVKKTPDITLATAYKHWAAKNAKALFGNDSI